MSARSTSSNPVRVFLAGVAIVLTAAFGVLAFVAAALFHDLPDPASAQSPPRPATLVVLDADGRLIARRGPIVGAPISLADLPPHVPAAVLAVEDRRFYAHFGVDAVGLARATLANVRAGRVVQGGSTITQQLAKNLFLDGRRTIERKLREAALAVRLEHRYTKDQILELYLNQLYFGAGAFGVEAAAQRYFGVSATDLSIAQAAMLAGLLQAPSRLNPAVAPERAAERVTLVLDTMLRHRAITDAERRIAVAEPIRVRGERTSDQAGYFVDWIVARTDALDRRGAGDLVVRTTLDLDMQRAAEAAVRTVLAAEGEAHAIGQAALIAMDGDGAVRAMVGGRDYGKSQFNRAVQMTRQPGSAFKPFVFAAALESGLRPHDRRSDAAVEVEGWAPGNFTDAVRGDVTLTDALALSINTATVRVGEEAGRARVAALARRLGLAPPDELVPSMLLGSVGARPIDLAAAYAPFANGGFRVEPFGVIALETLEGTVIARPDRGAAHPALAGRTRRMMNAMMHETVARGTGRAADLSDLGWDAAGKTGTTNDFRDAWFVGYVRGFTAAAWVGNDDFTPMRRVTGGGAPAKIWRGFMAEALAGLEPRALETPPAWRTDPLATPMGRFAAEAEVERPTSEPPGSAPRPIAVMTTTPVQPPPAAAAPDAGGVREVVIATLPAVNPPPAGGPSPEEEASEPPDADEEVDPFDRSGLEALLAGLEPAD